MRHQPRTKSQQLKPANQDDTPPDCFEPQWGETHGLRFPAPSDYIPVAGPNLVEFNASNSSYGVGFNSNNGASGGGLSAFAGRGMGASTGYWGNPGLSTYGDVLGTAQVNTWHHYDLRWSSAGLPEAVGFYEATGTHATTGPTAGHKVALFLDGALATSWYLDDYCALVPSAPGPCGFFPLLEGALMIGMQGVRDNFPGGGLSIQDLRIFDAAGSEVLHNTLGSIEEITHSNVGPNGSYLAGSFVPGFAGGTALHFGPGDSTGVPDTSSVLALLAPVMAGLAFVHRSTSSGNHSTGTQI